MIAKHFFLPGRRASSAPTTSVRAPILRWTSPQQPRSKFVPTFDPATIFSETTLIEAERAAVCGAPFQHFIGDNCAPRSHTRVATKSRPSTSSEENDQVESTTVQPRPPTQAPDRAPIARRTCPNERQTSRGTESRCSILANAASRPPVHVIVLHFLDRAAVPNPQSVRV